jgi:type III secretory pathway component EscU
MKNTNILSKIFLYLCVLSGVLWIGGYFARMILTYQLFEKTDFLLKSFMNSQNLPGIFFVLSAGIILTSVLYIIFVVSFIIFLGSSKISLKENGWLFIIAILVLITAPFEIYLMTIDKAVVNIIYSGVYNVNDVLALIIKRFKIFGSFPIIELLCYFAITYLFIFQPMKMSKKTVKHED